MNENMKMATLKGMDYSLLKVKVDILKEFGISNF